MSDSFIFIYSDGLHIKGDFYGFVNAYFLNPKGLLFFPIKINKYYRLQKIYKYKIFDLFNKYTKKDIEDFKDHFRIFSPFYREIKQNFHKEYNYISNLKCSLKTLNSSIIIDFETVNYLKLKNLTNLKLVQTIINLYPFLKDSYVLYIKSKNYNFYIPLFLLYRHIFFPFWTRQLKIMSQGFESGLHRYDNISKIIFNKIALSKTSPCNLFTIKGDCLTYISFKGFYMDDENNIYKKGRLQNVWVYDINEYFPVD